MDLAISGSLLSRDEGMPTMGFLSSKYSTESIFARASETFQTDSSLMNLSENDSSRSNYASIKKNLAFDFMYGAR